MTYSFNAPLDRKNFGMDSVSEWFSGLVKGDKTNYLLRTEGYVEELLTPQHDIAVLVSEAGTGSAKAISIFGGADEKPSEWIVGPRPDPDIVDDAHGEIQLAGLIDCAEYVATLGSAFSSTISTGGSSGTLRYLYTSLWGNLGNGASIDSSTKSNYYDAEKLAEGSTYNGRTDDLLCWAATASNILTAQGWASNGSASYANEDRVMDHFVDEWADKGFYESVGCTWWINGTIYPGYEAELKSMFGSLPGGGSYFDLKTSVTDLVNDKLYYSESNTYQTVLSNIMDNLNYGMLCGLSIYMKVGNSYGFGHAITCWGYEIGSDGSIYLYISDSDNSRTATTDRRDAANMLKKERVVLTDGELAFTGSYNSNTYYIKGCVGLKQYDKVYEGLEETYADAIDLGSTSSAIIRGGDMGMATDEDYYSFTVGYDGLLTINLNSVASNVSLWTTVSVLDTNGNVLSTYNAAKSHSFTMLVTEGSEYIIEVDDAGSATASIADSAYTLSITEEKIGVDLLKLNSANDYALISHEAGSKKESPSLHADQDLYLYFSAISGYQETVETYTITCKVDNETVYTIDGKDLKFLTPEEYEVNIGQIAVGNHTLEVSIDSAYGTSSYTRIFKVRGATVDIEYNDTMSIATQLGVVNGYHFYNNASIDPIGDVDYYQFALSSTGGKNDYVRIDIEGGVDLELALYNYSGKLLASSNGTSNYEKLSLANYSEGVYYIKVYAADGQATGDYSLSMETPISNVLKSDFNENGISDLLLTHNGGAVGAWMDGSNTWKSIGAVTSAWQTAGVDDFDNDGISDVLLKHGSSGLYGYWSDANSSKWTTLGNAESGMSLIGTADLDNNGYADLVFQNQTTGAVRYWMDGYEAKTKVVGNFADWSIAGMGDFNGDGKDDVLVRQKNGDIAGYWASGDASNWNQLNSALSSDWEVVAVSDFNGSGLDDILIYNANRNILGVWENGTTSWRTVSTQLDTANWTIAGTGDYNGDGSADILLCSDSGVVGYWASGREDLWSSIGGGLSSDWKVIA